MDPLRFGGHDGDSYRHGLYFLVCLAQRMETTSLMKNFMKFLFETVVLYLHGKDENKAKRVMALGLICLLFAFAIGPIWKMFYGIVYSFRNNLPPTSFASNSNQPPPMASLTLPKPVSAVVDNSRELPEAGPPAPHHSARRPH